MELWCTTVSSPESANDKSYIFHLNQIFFVPTDWAFCWSLGYISALLCSVFLTAKSHHRTKVPLQIKHQISSDIYDWIDTSLLMQLVTSHLVWTMKVCYKLSAICCLYSHFHKVITFLVNTQNMLFTKQWCCLFTGKIPFTHQYQNKLCDVNHWKLSLKAAPSSSSTWIRRCTLVSVLSDNMF